MVQCPECGSQRVWKDGLRYPRGSDQPIQRYLCRSCGYRFSEAQVKVNVSRQICEMPDPRLHLLNGGVVGVNLPIEKLHDNFALSGGKDVGSHEVTTVGKPLNVLGSYNRNRRVCASETKAAKNLVEVESQIEKRAAGATKADVKGKIIEYAWWLKKEGYADSTVRTRSRNLRRLVKLGANIYDPENVKETIAGQSTWSINTKANIVDAYNIFIQMLGRTWRPPKYKMQRVFPFIPTETELDQLIASCGNKTATFLQTLKETGMRAGEAFHLEWIDIDVERRLINLRHPEKGSNPRIFKVSAKLMGMLFQLPRKSKKVFGNTTLSSLRGTFCISRKKAARKLANPRIMSIHFHTFRHWKATTEYHKTKDILHVQSMLGHRRITNTQIYINLEQAIFSEGDNSEYSTRIAKTVKGARALLEAGFEFVTDMDGFKIFRKRK